MIFFINIINSFSKPLSLDHCFKAGNFDKIWTLDVQYKNNLFATPGSFSSKPADFVKATFNSNTYSGKFQGMAPGKNGNIQANYPTAKIDAGKVSATDKRSTFKPFDISKAGLLPKSSWLTQRDESLKKSLK